MRERLAPSHSSSHSTSYASTRVATPMRRSAAPRAWPCSARGRAISGHRASHFSAGVFVGFCGVGMVVRPVFGKVNDAGDAYIPLPVDPADYYVITVPIDKFQKLFKSGKPAFPPSEAKPDLLPYAALATANLECLELDALEGSLGEIPITECDDLHKYIAYPIGDVQKAHPDAGPLRYMCGIQVLSRCRCTGVSGAHRRPGLTVGRVLHLPGAILAGSPTRPEWRAWGALSDLHTLRNSRLPIYGGHAQDGDGVQRRRDRRAGVETDRRHMGCGGERAIPTPSYYYLDENLTHSSGGWSNATPYLVNQIGDWEKRGGARTVVANTDMPSSSGTPYSQVRSCARPRDSTRWKPRMNPVGAPSTRSWSAITRSASACRLTISRTSRFPSCRRRASSMHGFWRRGGRHVMRSSATEAALRAIPWDRADRAADQGRTAMTRKTQLLEKRRRDVLELLAEIFPKQTIGLGSNPSSPPPKAGTHAVSSRELEWFAAPGTTVEILPPARAQTVPHSGIALTAQNTFEALTVSYSPRYFIVSGMTIEKVTVYLLYSGLRAMEGPAIELT